MKKIYIAILTLLTIGMVTIVSCSKESNTNPETSQIIKSTGNPGQELVHIATGNINAGSESIDFEIDMTVFEQEFNQVLADSLGNNYIFNDLQIIDDEIGNTDEVPYLAISIVDINTGNTTTYYTPIVKEPEGNNMLYYGNRGGQVEVYCYGNNCQDGCALNASRTGCTGCSNANQGGTCNSVVRATGQGEGPTVWEVAGVVLAVIGIIVTIGIGI